MEPPLSLPTTKQMKEALLNKQMRRIKPAGKRHGKGFAQALSMYASVCTAARKDLADINKTQGDRQEAATARLRADIKANWDSVAPRRATQRKTKKLITAIKENDQ
jgi:hypothetical protein